MKSAPTRWQPFKIIGFIITSLMLSDTYMLLQTKQSLAQKIRHQAIIWTNTNIFNLNLGDDF